MSSFLGSFLIFSLNSSLSFSLSSSLSSSLSCSLSFSLFFFSDFFPLHFSHNFFLGFPLGFLMRSPLSSSLNFSLSFSLSSSLIFPPWFLPWFFPWVLPWFFSLSSSLIFPLGSSLNFPLSFSLTFPQVTHLLSYFRSHFSTSPGWTLQQRSTAKALLKSSFLFYPNPWNFLLAQLWECFNLERSVPFFFLFFFLVKFCFNKSGMEGLRDSPKCISDLASATKSTKFFPTWAKIGSPKLIFIKIQSIL